MVGKKNRKSNQRASMPRNPDPSTIKYTGPITNPAVDSTTVMLYEVDTISSAAITGLIQAVYNNNPSSANNWADYAAAWDNYRVLGIKFEYFPINNVNTTAVAGFAGFTGVLHGSTTVPSTIALAASTGVVRPWYFCKYHRREWKMQDANESAFQSCTAPASTSNTLNLFANGAAGITYGYLLISYYVQFKSHRQ